jgi:hypothetical protein
MYDLRDHLPQVGKNEISIHLTKANEDFRRQVPLEITDVELEIDYRFPNGRWNDQR